LLAAQLASLETVPDRLRWVPIEDPEKSLLPKAAMSDVTGGDDMRSEAMDMGVYFPSSDGSHCLII
jgi:hypothetical protein